MQFPQFLLLLTASSISGVIATPFKGIVRDSCSPGTLDAFNLTAVDVALAKISLADKVLVKDSEDVRHYGVSSALSLPNKLIRVEQASLRAFGSLVVISMLTTNVPH